MDRACGIDEVAADWAGLHARHPHATPFTSLGWARAWWPHWAADAEPFLLRVREGDRTIALAPLVRRRTGPLRILEPVGSEPGDYWDVLAAQEDRSAACEALAQALAARTGGWDALILRLLPPDSPLPEAVRAAGLATLERPAARAPAVELPATFDAYLKSVSGNRRQNIRRHLKRLDGGEVELTAIEDPELIAPALERWQDFRRAQWDAQGKDINPEHLSPRFKAFIGDLLRELIPAGQALLWEFRADGKVIGTYVNFVDEHAFYWYLGGFDPEVAALGLGKIAITHGMRTSIDAGRTRYDFTRGPEPYKYWYGAQDRLLPALVVGSASVRSRAALAGARIQLARRDRNAATDAEPAGAPA